MQEEVAAALLAASATPQHHHIAEDDEEMTNGDNNSGDVSRDLDIDESIKDPVEDRRTLAERSERLHDQLKVRLTEEKHNFVAIWLRKERLWRWHYSEYLSILVMEEERLSMALSATIQQPSG